MMEADDMFDILGSRGRVDSSEPAIKRTKDKIEQQEKVAKMAKAIYDLVSAKLKDVRQLGDYQIHREVVSLLKSMDSRARDATFTIAEEKAYLDTQLEAKGRYEGMPATMRGRRKKQQKVRPVANYPKLLKNIKRFTR